MKDGTIGVILTKKEYENYLELKILDTTKPKQKKDNLSMLKTIKSLNAVDGIS